MRLIVIGAVVMLLGLGVLFAMVIRLLEPGLGLSLLSYAAAFAGMMMLMLGIAQQARGGR